MKCAWLFCGIIAAAQAHARPRFVRLRHELAEAALIGRVRLTGYDAKGAPCWQVLEPKNAPQQAGCLAVSSPFDAPPREWTGSTLTALWPPVGWEGLVVQKDGGEVSLFARNENGHWRFWSPIETGSVAIFDCEPPARPLARKVDDKTPTRSWDGCEVDRRDLALRFRGPVAKPVHGGPPVTNDYLDATFFQQLAALVPEMKGARLISLTEAGQRLWEAGQMRVHGEGSFTEGDFDGDGQREVAILITDGQRSGLLIATDASGSWQRVAFIRVDRNASVRVENGLAKVGPSEKILVWDGEAYSLESPISVRALPLGKSDLVLKITYIGRQESTVPGLLLTSYRGLPTVDLFRQWRTPGVSYVNDEAGAFLTVTASDEALDGIASELEHWPPLYRARKRSWKNEAVFYSLTFGRSAGKTFKVRPTEVFLSLDETQRLFALIADQLQKENPGGAERIRQMR